MKHIVSSNFGFISSRNKLSIIQRMRNSLRKRKCEACQKRFKPLHGGHRYCGSKKVKGSCSHKNMQLKNKESLKSFLIRFSKNNKGSYWTQVRNKNIEFYRLYDLIKYHGLKHKKRT